MPNPNSLILNILLWNIIKMTHPIAFVNYWIFEKLRLIIETFKYQLLLATKSFHLHSLRTSSTFTPFTWARCTSTTRVSYNTYRSRLRRRWTASRGTRSPRVPAPVAKRTKSSWPICHLSFYISIMTWNLVWFQVANFYWKFIDW